MKAEKTRMHLNRCAYADENIADWDFKETELELNELERLARIGRATEKAFEKGQMMLIDDLYFIKDVECLLQWAEMEE